MTKIALYACGGAGLNMVSSFTQHSGTKEAGFAGFQPYFVDTSDSNRRNDMPDSQTYKVEGVDGGGKVRTGVYEAAAPFIKEILHKLKPEDFNIVIHSAGGGSGSVLGPAIVSELLARGLPTIVVMVGTFDSTIEARNTIRTIEGYDHMARMRNTPVICSYHENGRGKTRAEVDTAVRTTIALLSVIMSGENRELDSQDLKNFLDYTKVTGFQPQLTYLDFFSKDVVMGRGQAVASMVTLTDEATPSVANVPVEYQAVGFINPAAKDTVAVPFPLHSTTIVGHFHEPLERLKKLLAESEEARMSTNHKPLTSTTVAATVDGLLF